MPRESIKEASGTPAAEQKQNGDRVRRFGRRLKKKKKKKKYPGAYPRIRLEAPIYSNGYLSAHLRAHTPAGSKRHTCCGAEKLEGGQTGRSPALGLPPRPEQKNKALPEIGAEQPPH